MRALIALLPVLTGCHLLLAFSSGSSDHSSPGGDGQVPAERSVGPDRRIERRPSEASAASPQPLPVHPRPGGGAWKLVFHDEFDGSGGLTAAAMSGSQWIGKTLGGGSLPGNPGLNPRKWNVGWYTGPATLDGDGNVQRATYWHGTQPLEYQWWALEAIQFPGDDTLTLRPHQRVYPGGAQDADIPAWTKSQDAYGMVSTAGLFAINPASAPTGSIPAGRYCNGPTVLEWREWGAFAVDWPANWMTSWGNFGGGSAREYPGGEGNLGVITLVAPGFSVDNLDFEVLPAGANKDDWITWTWFFDRDRIICWCTPKDQPTRLMFDIPGVVAFKPAGYYLMLGQQTKVVGAPAGDTKYDYVRIWN